MSYLDRRLGTDLPWWAYLDALHDRVHTDVGQGRAARTVRHRPTVWRCPRCGAADWSECVCPPHEEA